MGDARSPSDIVEFHDDFRLAVFQILQFINNELGNERHRVRPDDQAWRLQRAKTIAKLNELIGKLDTTCVVANYGKGVGLGAAVVGDITSILGAIMEWRESSSAQTLTNLGNLVSKSGSLLEGASNVAESFISSKYLLEIEEVLKKDQELSMPLQEWLSFSRNMDANVRKIFGCGLNSAVQNNVLKIFSEFMMLHSCSRDFNETIDLMKRGTYSSDIGTNVPIERLSRFSSQLEMYPDIREGIREICTTLNNSTTAIQVVREGVRVYRNFYGESRASVNSESQEVGTECSSSDNNPESPFIGHVSTYCSFQTINVAVKTVHLSTVMMNIKDGKSKYSRALSQISDLLAMELRSMEGL